MSNTRQQKRERDSRWPGLVRRAALVMTGVFAMGVALAACGGPSTPGVATGSTTTSTTTPGSSTNGGTQGTGSGTGLLAYSACMRAHGVPNFPDPGSSGGIPKSTAAGALRDVSNSRSQAATSDCQHLLPVGKSLGGQPSQTVTAQDQHYYLNAVSCMRSHGIANFPDPVFSGGSVNFPFPASINQNSPQFIRAAQTCTKLIPAGLPKG